MALTTTTTVTHEIPELWSAITADDREENLIVFNTYDRRYESEAGSSAYDTINILSVGNFTTGPTLGVGATLTYEAGVLNAPVQLVIDTHAYHAFDLETEAELMTDISLMSKLSHKSGYAVALKMDDDAAGMIDDFGTNVVGTLGQALDEEDVRTAQRMLDDAIVPEDGRVFIMAPIPLSHFMGIDKLTNNLFASRVGNLNVQENKRRGTKGHLHGATWMVTGNVEGSNSAGHDNGMYHAEVVAVAVIDNMRTAKAYEIDTDSDKFAMHSIYGLIEVRDDHGVFMRGL